MLFTLALFCLALAAVTGAVGYLGSPGSLAGLLQDLALAFLGLGLVGFVLGLLRGNRPGR